jgi:hypothetical protein
LASKRHWTVSFALSSILWSKIKSAEELEKAKWLLSCYKRKKEEAQELAKANLSPCLFSHASLESHAQAPLLIAIYK